MATAVGAKALIAKSNSQLVAHQFVEIYEVKEPILRKYLAKVKKWAAKFHKVQIDLIPREANQSADYLARMVSGDPAKGFFQLTPIPEEDLIQASAIVGNIE